MSLRREPFASIPRRLDEAADSGELEQALACLLKRLIYRCGPPKSGIFATTFTLRELAEWLRGRKQSVEKLRRDLHELQRLDWVRLESPGRGAPRNGGGKVWRLVLTGGAVEFN